METAKRLWPWSFRQGFVVPGRLRVQTARLTPTNQGVHVKSDNSSHRLIDIFHSRHHQSKSRYCSFSYVRKDFLLEFGSSRNDLKNPVLQKIGGPKQGHLKPTFLIYCHCIGDDCLWTRKASQRCLSLDSFFVCLGLLGEQLFSFEFEDVGSKLHTIVKLKYSGGSSTWEMD